MFVASWKLFVPSLSSSELNEILNSECRPLCEAFDRGYWGKRIKVCTFWMRGGGGRSAGAWRRKGVARRMTVWRVRLTVARVWRGWGRWRWRRMRKRGGSRGHEPGLILDLSNSVRMLVEISKQNSFLVVRSTKDFVIVQIELVTHTKPDKIALSDWLFIELEVSISSSGSESTHLWPHCWHAKHSRWYTLVLALITISKAGITLLHAAQ